MPYTTLTCSGSGWCGSADCNDEPHEFQRWLPDGPPPDMKDPAVLREYLEIAVLLLTGAEERRPTTEEVLLQALEIMEEHAAEEDLRRVWQEMEER